MTLSFHDGQIVMKKQMKKIAAQKLRLRALNFKKPPQIEEVKINMDVKDPPELPEKQVAYALLKENGCTTQQATKALGYKLHTGYVLNTKIKKYSLKKDKIVKSAHTAIKNLIQAKKFGDIEEIKDSTVLQASKIIYDRYEPVVQKIESTSLSITITDDMRASARRKLLEAGMISE